MAGISGTVVASIEVFGPVGAGMVLVGAAVMLTGVSFRVEGCGVGSAAGAAPEAKASGTTVRVETVMK
jgi:hypothetical protein